MTRHSKTAKPTDADLKGNPMIGAGKGATMAHATPDDVEDAEGANTMEGDVMNDVNRQGGVNKAEARSGRRRRRS